MVYVDSDGTVYQERPWSIGKVMSILWGITNLIIAFFQTLIPGLTEKGSSNGFRSGGPNRGGSSGGSGGGGSGGRRPPRPPGPGNIHGLSSLPKAPNPPPACGSCCGR